MIIFKINWLKFLHLNFFSKRVKRKKGFFFPYFGAKVKISKNAKLFVNANVHFGLQSAVSFRKKTFLILKDSGFLVFNSHFSIQQGTYIEVRKKGELFLNGGVINEDCFVVCEKRINIGNNLLASRNVTIRDCDGHRVITDFGSNEPKPIFIGEHVWLCQNVFILKGITIGDNSIVAANTTITKNVSPNCVCFSKNEQKERVIIDWKR